LMPTASETPGQSDVAKSRVANCAEYRTMRRYIDFTAKNAASMSVGGANNSVRFFRALERSRERWIVGLCIICQSYSRYASRASLGLKRKCFSGVSAKVDNASSFIERFASTY